MRRYPELFAPSEIGIVELALAALLPLHTALRSIYSFANGVAD
jgi:hypothetical protein